MATLCCAAEERPYPGVADPYAHDRKRRESSPVGFPVVFLRPVHRCCPRGRYFWPPREGIDTHTRRDTEPVRRRPRNLRLVVIEYIGLEFSLCWTAGLILFVFDARVH